eukprot:123090_1
MSKQHKDDYLTTYYSLINMGYPDEISLKAALKYPKNIDAAITFIDKIGFIDVPVHIECKRNSDYCCHFTLAVAYHDQLNFSFTQLIKDIIEYIHQHYRPVKFYAKRICNDSFIKQELNDTDADWYQWNTKITDYSGTDISQIGLHVFVEISKYEHSVNVSDITCNSLLLSKEDEQNEKQKFGCSIYAQMYYEYKYNEDNLAHVENYNHFRNEHLEKEQCKYGDECHAFKRLESGQSGIQVVEIDYKMKCARHKRMGSPLNRAEMLSVVLYTGCRVTYDLCEKQRKGDYTTWKWFDYCLYNAISKLSRMEHGRYKIYSGLTNAKLNQKYIESGYFKTYVSTSWDKSTAIGFIEGKGMLIEMDEQFRENNICADVSWISKFPDEMEVLIVRSVDALFNNFQCRIVDDKDGIQTIMLSQYGAHKEATSLITEMNNMNLEDDPQETITEQTAEEENSQSNSERSNDTLNGLDDDNKDENKLLTLVSSEEVNPRVCIVSMKAASLSKLVNSIVQSDATAVTIPMKNVRGDILELVVEYLKHHNGRMAEEIAKPIRSVRMARIVADPWDAAFIDKMNKKTIFQVILAANYMDISSLLHLGCAKIATLIKGKSPDEIKNILATSTEEAEQKDD